jgi:phosphoribosylformylglycinamidine synthase subunit PurS
MEYQVEIKVVPRRGILDPQGKAVHGALTSLGFAGVEEVHVGRLIRIELHADDADSARERAQKMCRQLLANPVTEDFDIVIHEGAGSGR